MSNWLKAKNNGSKSRDKSNGDGKMEFHKTEWNRDENRQRHGGGGEDEAKGGKIWQPRCG